MIESRRRRRQLCEVRCDTWPAHQYCSFIPSTFELSKMVGVDNSSLQAGVLHGLVGSAAVGRCSIHSSNEPRELSQLSAS